MTVGGGPHVLLEARQWGPRLGRGKRCQSDAVQLALSGVSVSLFAGLVATGIAAVESCEHCDLNLNPHANEKWLLHGTTWATVDPLVLQGFDHRLSGRDRDLYGPGTYLATDSWKIHQYHKRKGRWDRPGQLGEPVRPALRRPGPTQRRAGDKTSARCQRRRELGATGRRTDS